MKDIKGALDCTQQAWQVLVYQQGIEVRAYALLAGIAFLGRCYASRHVSMGRPTVAAIGFGMAVAYPLAPKVLDELVAQMQKYYVYDEYEKMHGLWPKLFKLLVERMGVEYEVCD